MFGVDSLMEMSVVLLILDERVGSQVDGIVRQFEDLWVWYCCSDINSWVD